MRGELDTQDIYDSMKESMYVVWSLLFTLAFMIVLDMKGVIDFNLGIPAEVYIYGVGALFAVVFGFAVADKMDF